MQSFRTHASHKANQRDGSPCGVAPTAQQLGTLMTRLDDQLAELHQRLARNEEVVRSLAEDSSVDGVERQAARLAAEQDHESIQATNRAITAIDAGTYGVCTTCGCQIPFERLQALPTTQSCVACPDYP